MISKPEKGHGLLTYYFLEAIKDGKSDIADIDEQIKPQIEDEAKALNVQQSPEWEWQGENTGSETDWILN